MKPCWSAHTQSSDLRTQTADDRRFTPFGSGAVHDGSPCAGRHVWDHRRRAGSREPWHRRVLSSDRSKRRHASVLIVCRSFSLYKHKNNQNVKSRPHHSSPSCRQCHITAEIIVLVLSSRTFLPYLGLMLKVSKGLAGWCTHFSELEEDPGFDTKTQIPSHGTWRRLDFTEKLFAEELSFCYLDFFLVLNMKVWFGGGGQHSWVICHRHTQPKIRPGRFFFFLLRSFRVSIKRNGMTYSSEDKHASPWNIPFFFIMNASFRSNVCADQTEGPCRLHGDMNLHRTSKPSWCDSARGCEFCTGMHGCKRLQSRFQATFTSTARRLPLAISVRTSISRSIRLEQLTTQTTTGEVFFVCFLVFGVFLQAVKVTQLLSISCSDEERLWPLQPKAGLAYF